MSGVSKFRVGLFMISAVALLIAMLFFLGMSDLFVHKAHLATLFGESVQGLAVGSAVKYKGVAVGTVDDIVIQVDDKRIRVNMSVELNTFRKSHASGSLFRNQAEFDRFLEKEINEGLRCRLEYAGITGLRYVDFDYYAPPGPPAEKAGELNDPSTFFIPSSPSAFKDIAKSLNTSLERISKIRFEEISDNLVNSLSDINRLLAAPEIKDTLRHLNSMSINLDRATGSINQVVTEERLQNIAEQTEQTLQAIRSLSDRISADADRVDLPACAVAFRDAASVIQEAAEAIASRRQDLAVTMEKLGRALDSLRELTDMLNQDPSALVRGRRQPGSEGH